MGSHSLCRQPTRSSQISSKCLHRDVSPLKRVLFRENEKARKELCSRELSTVGNHNGLLRLAQRTSYGLDGFHYVHPLDDLPEHDMLSVQPWGGNGAQKELRSICVHSGIRHGQDPRPGVLLDEVLVGKPISINGLPTSTVTPGEITTLQGTDKRLRNRPLKQDRDS